MRRFKRNIINSGQIAKGGWNGFKHPKTGFEFIGDYKGIEDLIYHIKKYEEQNGLDTIVNIRAFIEDFFCHQPGGGFDCEELARISRTTRQLAAGATAFIKAKVKKIAGEEFAASKERATARAGMCANCNKNVPAGVQIGDEKVEDLYKEDEYKTPHDGRLIKCDACGGCPLTPKVWFPPDIIIDSIKGQTFKNLNCLISTNHKDPSKRVKFVCWMMEERYLERVKNLHNQGLLPEVISDQVEGLSTQIINKWIQDDFRRNIQ